MADFEFAIAVVDEADLASGHKRKKAGDIIAVKPAPWNWGTKEVDEYLIVPVSGLTKEEAHDLCKPEYEDGIDEPQDDMNKDMPVWIPETSYRIAGESGEQVWGPDRIRTSQYIHVCIQAGISGTAEPTWATKVVNMNTIDSAAETIDGTVKWRCIEKCSIFKHQNKTSYEIGDKIIISDVIYECLESGTSGVDIAITATYKAETVDGTVRWKSLGKVNPSIIIKRRYSIPIDNIKKGWKTDMVTADVEDKKKVYQPLKDNNIKLDFSEKVAICKDNFSSKYKYAAAKIAEA